MATVGSRTDGFGAQFQTIIYGIIIIETHGQTYYHTPILSMAHNYDNDPNFLNKVEELMNIRNNYKCITDNDRPKIIVHNFQTLRKIFEQNINAYLMSPSLKNIKLNFWKNKERNHFKNDRLNVAVHIRTNNKVDIQLERFRVSRLQYYFNIINNIRQKYRNSKKLPLFHIYSQNKLHDYKLYNNNDIYYHLNENMFDSFIGMVAADILVTSKSSYSYIAAILSDGEIYYNPFWHPPKNSWIVC
jgi:hypothetical protein